MEKKKNIIYQKISLVKKTFKNLLVSRDMDQNLWKSRDGAEIPLKDMKVVILTGAGVSRDSGINTFRDNDGMWEQYKVEDVCRPEALRDQPAVVHKFYDERRQKVNRDIASREEWIHAVQRKIKAFVKLEEMGFKKYGLLSNALREVLKSGEKVDKVYGAFKGGKWILPNESHYAIEELVKYLKGQGAEVEVVTQNIDELHEMAGTSEVYHMHGMLNMTYCQKCRYSEYSQEGIGYPNHCPECGTSNTLRPDVVFFKENPKYMTEIGNLVNAAQVLISIGTSGVVYPAAGFAQTVRRNKGKAVSVNPFEVNNEWMFDYVLAGNGYWGMGRILDSLEANYGKRVEVVSEEFYERALNGLVDVELLREVSGVKV